MDASGDDNMLLPIAGAAANAAQKAGLIKDLFSPTAKVLGAHWGKRTQEWLNGEPDRHAKNVSGHIDKVRAIENIEPSKNDPTERQFVALAQWTEKAQTVDPELEPELAALWQSLLADIFKNDPEADELQNILKEMNRADAREFLLMAETSGRGVRPPYLERFKRWGLVENSLQKQSIQRFIILGGGTGMLALLGTQLPNLIKDYSESQSTAQFASMSLVMAGVILLCLILFALREITQVSLTPLGLRLLKSGERYFRAKMPEAANVVPVEPEQTATVVPDAPPAKSRKTRRRKTPEQAP
jgi:hypothetical protein